MNPRQRNSLLWSLAAFVALGGLALVVAGVGMPVRAGAAPSEKLQATLRTLASAKSADTNPSRSRELPALEELRQLTSAGLRRSLAAQTQSTAAPSGLPLTLQLIGTASEREHSVAMLKKTDGTIVTCLVGESTDDVGGAVVITRIETDRIEVTYANSRRELRIPPQPTGLEGATP